MSIRGCPFPIFDRHWKILQYSNCWISRFTVEIYDGLHILVYYSRIYYSLHQRTSRILKWRDNFRVQQVLYLSSNQWTEISYCVYMSSASNIPAILSTLNSSFNSDRSSQLHMNSSAGEKSELLVLSFRNICLCQRIVMNIISNLPKVHWNVFW